MRNGYEDMVLKHWRVLMAIGVLFAAQVHAEAQVRYGADLLLSDSLHLIEGRRVGLLANHTSRLSNGVLLFDTLRALPGVTLTAVFSPEHGFRGTAADGVHVGSGRVAGIPLHSLYGETRRPAPDMLADIDVLILDLQDVGARYYTYLTTMALCLEAATDAGLPVIVCDRPNPVGGVLVEGPIRDEDMQSFVAFLPIPVRHGLTVGEVLTMALGEDMLAVSKEPRLTVVPASGWRRGMLWDDTGLVWINPSPNMRSPDAALAYPGTCLLEGTNLNEGRGTEAPFLQFGAPFIDGEILAGALNARGLPGVRFHPTRYIPAAQPGAPHPRFRGERIEGIRLEIIDRRAFQSVRTGLEILFELRGRYGAFISHTSYLYRLFGVPDFLDGSLSAIVERCNEDVRSFLTRRTDYLLYP
ncbi:MAG: DUF1343 domain-containing protein [Bacteroidetes bacterium]|nr:DUF1343 domain-containing protein [Bacteroidota bacterium]